MCRRFHGANLVLDGFAVDAIEVNSERVQIKLRSCKLPPKITLPSGRHPHITVPSSELPV